MRAAADRAVGRTTVAPAETSTRISKVVFRPRGVKVHPLRVVFVLSSKRCGQLRRPAVKGRCGFAPGRNAAARRVCACAPGVHVCHRGATLLRVVCARVPPGRNTVARRVCTCATGAQHCCASCVHVCTEGATLPRFVDRLRISVASNDSLASFGFRVTYSLGHNSRQCPARRRLSG
jgi:hypothetical protein